MRLKRNHSYLAAFIGVFSVSVICLIAAGIGFQKTAMIIPQLMFVLVTGGLLCLQVWSGVALDSKWVARYPRGTWQYRMLIGWNSVILVVAFVVVYLSWPVVAP